MAVNYLATMEKLRGKITEMMNDYAFAKNTLESGKWQNPLDERSLTKNEIDSLAAKKIAVENIVGQLCQDYKVSTVET